MAPYMKTGTVHLSRSQWRELNEHVDKVCESNKVERRPELRYAGKILALHDVPEEVVQDD